MPRRKKSGRSQEEGRPEGGSETQGSRREAAETNETGGATSSEAKGHNNNNGGKKGKYRKEKPWDTDDVEHWKIEPFLPVRKALFPIVVELSMSH